MYSSILYRLKTQSNIQQQNLFQKVSVADEADLNGAEE